jgi:hypothetical protein
VAVVVVLKTAVPPAQFVSHPGAAGHEAEHNSSAAKKPYNNREKALARLRTDSNQICSGKTVKIPNKTGLMTEEISERTGMMTGEISEKTGMMTGADTDVGVH